MQPATELHRFPPNLFVWQNYDPAVKAELFASAISTPAGMYIVDPIPLAADGVARLSEANKIAGVIVTNANHHRASVDYSDEFSVPLFAQPGAFPDRKPGRSVEVADGTTIGEELEVITINGAVLGEIALYHPLNGGTLVVGDALINFEPYGFAFLPRKYCINEREMRQSLRKLLGYKMQRLLFAHGTPILSGASERLEQLLGLDR